jgi:putative ATPase
VSASLFDEGSAPTRASAPLAVRMRPRTLDELVGQQHLLAPGSPLRRLITAAQDGGPGPTSVILWGPPGTGKTTLASLVSTSTGRRFVQLSAVTAGVKDVREVIDRARDALGMHGTGTVLFVDEVHRFSKTQQDALLPAVENGWVTLVAATTENPSFSVISPLLSRSLVLTLASLTDDDVRDLLHRAVTDPRGLDGTVELSAEAEDHLLRIAGGDARRALTSLEAAAGAALDTGTHVIDLSAVERAVDKAAPRYDRDGDQHYDVISAFIKSCRGSDVDAALHYLARMLEAGEDPRFIARRLIILASEDVGLADPTALQTAVAAATAVALIGLPEGRLTLAQATIAIALAPKSNAVITAIGAAEDDVRRGLIGPVPPHLRDAHYARAGDLGHGVGYDYPHSVPGGVAAQQYGPDQLGERRYYVPTRYGAEARYADVLERLRVALGRDPARASDADQPARPDQPHQTAVDPPIGSDRDESPTDQSSREVRP